MRERRTIFFELLRREGLFEGDDGSLAADLFNLFSMLGSLPEMKNLATMNQKPFRLKNEHFLFERIHTILIQGNYLLV